MELHTRGIYDDERLIFSTQFSNDTTPRSRGVSKVLNQTFSPLSFSFLHIIVQLLSTDTLATIVERDQDEYALISWSTFQIMGSQLRKVNGYPTKLQTILIHRLVF